MQKFFTHDNKDLTFALLQMKLENQCQHQSALTPEAELPREVFSGYDYRHFPFTQGAGLS